MQKEDICGEVDFMTEASYEKRAFYMDSGTYDGNQERKGNSYPFIN